ncbi:MAG: TetR/AcrR family transcriptional regulator [Myxococcales bacterium]|nr:TetR/AcrR family transcriptional regulator [Myxococcales bacterium]
MARPPNADAARTRERIRRAASELFAERGLGRTSVRAIAKAAGVSVAMVSHHFGGKEPLYQACVDSMYEELGEMQGSLLEALSGDRPLDATLREAVVMGLRHARAHQPALRLVMRHVIDTGSVPAERRDRWLKPALAMAPTVLAGRTPRSPEQLRFAIQSVLFLVTRYALASDEDLALLVGEDGDATAAVEEQLGLQACALLGVS